jgi:2-polyprenyl-6-methoxyphenol hydroxylase-like FAD-dependent oxidoreductase
MGREEAPVIIGGAGLVGLSTAMFLAQRGVPSIALERLKAPSTLPRAAFFHMRTFELFRAAGIEDQVRRQSEAEFTPDGAIVGVESLAGRETAAFIPSLNEGVEALSPCRRWFVSQPGLEPILRRRAEEVGATVANGLEVARVDQDADGVTVVARDVETGEERFIRGRYFVDCEGAHSRVREQLGIPMLGRGVFSNSITIYLRADLAPFLTGRNLSIIYVNNPVLGGFFRLEKSSQRGFLVVNTVGDPIADPEAAANVAADVSEPRLIELVRAAAGDPTLKVEIEGCARWRCTSDVAERFQDGRIFIAGDSAHLMPPNGGFGGNTGIHDAHNLAWKLALVLDGQAGPALLDTYESERRPVGRFTVDQAYTRYVTRTAAYLKAKDPPPYQDDFRIELGYLYRSPAVLTEAGSPEGHEDPRQSFGRPGSRAPHVWTQKDGQRVSTLDLVGQGYAVIAGPEGRDWLAATERARAALPGLALTAHVLGPDVAEAYGLEPSGASLVRPDGFVAWRAKAAPPDRAQALTGALNAVLMRSPVAA